MNLVLVNPPQERILTVAQVKSELDIDSAAYDSKILSHIIAAESYLDGRDGVLGRCLRPQQWQLLLPGFTPCIKLPLPPTISVDLVEYFSTTEVLTTLAASNYRVTSGGYHGDSITPADGVTYPSTYERPDAVRVTFTAGYQDNFSPENEAIPEGILMAAKALCRVWYDAPESEIPGMVLSLIAPHRLTYVA